jgi:Ca2+-transporting ATPase
MAIASAWHSRPVEEVLAELKTSPAGLSMEEAAARLASCGANELVEREKRTAPSMLLDQFKDFMILVLIAAAVVSGAVGDPQDAIAIVVIVVLNAALGFSQEYRAEKAMAALKKLAPASATALRGGEAVTIPASRLVPGDLLILQAGDIVPADLRLIEAVRFMAEEAALTGESVPVDKQAAALYGADLPIGERKNMAYRGTIVTYGRATAVVTATGMKTELGRIAALLQDEDGVKTPLQKRLVAFGKKITVAVLAIRSERESLFAQGLFSNKPLLGAFILTFVLQLATIYAPALNPIFKTAPLTARELAFTLAMSSVVFVAVEAEKLFKRRASQDPRGRKRPESEII